MGVREIPQTFRTSDGREFTDKGEAERHEALVEAKREYDTARAVLGRRLAETQKTADGRPFEFGVFGDYYFVTEGWSGMPELLTVSFFGNNFSIDEHRIAEVVILQRAQGRDRDSEYRIADLYRGKAAAERALLEAQEAWLAKKTAEVAELRSRLIPEVLE
jgi:hypothetical protein